MIFLISQNIDDLTIDKKVQLKMFPLRKNVYTGTVYQSAYVQITVLYVRVCMYEYEYVCEVKCVYCIHV